MSILHDMLPGDRVREARELLDPKLSTKELDTLAGLTKGHVWSIEKTGGENAESSTLDGVARVLGLTMDWLIRGEGEAPTAASVAAAVEFARSAKKAEEEARRAAAEAAKEAS